MKRIKPINQSLFHKYLYYIFLLTVLLFHLICLKSQAQSINANSISPLSAIKNTDRENLSESSGNDELFHFVSDKIHDLIRIPDISSLISHKKFYLESTLIEKLTAIKILTSLPCYLFSKKNPLPDIVFNELLKISDSFAALSDEEIEEMINLLFSGYDLPVLSGDDLLFELKNAKYLIQSRMKQNPIHIKFLVDKISQKTPLSRSERLYESFKRQFPQNYEIMISLFGELLLSNSEIEDFFYKLMNLLAWNISVKQAVYIASVIRLKEDFFSDSRNLHYRFKNKNESIAYTNLEDDFLLWAVNKQINLNDFPLAYELFKNKELELKQIHGKNTRIRIQSNKKTGDDLYLELKNLIPHKNKTGKVRYVDNDYTLIQNLKSEKIEINEKISDILNKLELKHQDLKLKIASKQGFFHAYLLISNQEFIKTIEKQTGQVFDDELIIGFMKVNIIDAIPTVYGIQQRLFLDHSFDKKLLAALDDMMSVFYMIIENQISSLFYSANPFDKIRFITASWLLSTGNIPETIANKYYCEFPQNAGFSLISLNPPIVIGEGWKMNFCYEKRLIKQEFKQYFPDKKIAEKIKTTSITDTIIEPNLIIFQKKLKEYSGKTVKNLNDFISHIANQIKILNLEKEILSNPEIESLIMQQLILLFPSYIINYYLELFETITINSLSMKAA